MSTLKVNAISDSAGANGNAITLSTDGSCTVKATNRSSNIIVNGAMNVAQRGTSSTSSLYQTVDRFRFAWSGTDENPTQAQVDVASGTTPYTLGFRKSLKVTNGNQTSGAGADDRVAFEYRIEAQDIAGSGWNYVSASSNITLSFWVKSSVAQNFYFYLETVDGTAQIYTMETGALSADTWTKITKTIPGNSNIQVDNDNNIGLKLQFMYYTGTDYTNNSQSLNTWGAYSSASRSPDQTTTWYTTNDATFEMTGLQLEVGDVATDFEHRTYHDDLLACQRYYLVWADAPNAGEDEPIGSAFYNNGSYSFLTDCRFPVEMRGHPSVVSKNATNAFRVYGSGAGGAYFDQMDFNEQITTRMARVGGTANLDTSGKGAGIRAHSSGGGYLHFDAEL